MRSRQRVEELEKQTKAHKIQPMIKIFEDEDTGVITLENKVIVKRGENYFYEDGTLAIKSESHYIIRIKFVSP